MNLNTSLQPNDLKDLLKPLRPQFRYLSPLQGAALLSSHFLKRLLWDSVPGSLKSFASDTFSSWSRDCIELPRTKGSFTSYMNAEIIGHLIGLIENDLCSNTQKVEAVLERWYRVFDKKYTRTKIRTAFKSMVAAQREVQEGKYFPHCVTTLLLALLWLKAQDKKALTQYFETVQTYFLSSIFVRGVTASDAIVSSFDDSAIKTPGWTRADVLSLTPRKTEKLVARLFRQYRLPLLTYRYTTFQGHAKADCVESTIRNMINAVLYDADKNDFDREQLIALRPATAVVQFYNGTSNTHPCSRRQMPLSLDCLLDLSTAQAWMLSLRGLRGVEYLTPVDFEVRPSARNVLAVFNRLFPPTGTSQHSLLRWQDLGERLSTPKCLVEFGDECTRPKSVTAIPMKITRHDTGQVAHFHICWKCGGETEHMYMGFDYATFPSPVISPEEEHKGLFEAWKALLSGTQLRQREAVTTLPVLALFTASLPPEEVQSLVKAMGLDKTGIPWAQGNEYITKGEAEGMVRCMLLSLPRNETTKAVARKVRETDPDLPEGLCN